MLRDRERVRALLLGNSGHTGFAPDVGHVESDQATIAAMRGRAHARSWERFIAPIARANSRSRQSRTRLGYRTTLSRWACGAFTASAEIIAGVRCGLDERQFEDGAARPDPPVTIGGDWRFDTVVHEHWPLRDQESASPPPFSQTPPEDVARLIQRIGSIFDVTAEHHCLVPLVRWQNIGPERIRD